MAPTVTKDEEKKDTEKENEMEENVAKNHKTSS